MPPFPSHHHQQRQQQQQQVPEVGSIQEGKVVRIEPYGAFVELKNYYRVRGLVHISQLANYKVEQVADVVSLDDGVWVKVLDVTRETSDDGRTRTKVSLSLKEASQDDGRDLGEEMERNKALTQQISRNLQSSIGMGFAQDPMANTSNQQNNRGSDSRLVLKHQPKEETVINGYALVDDLEGEPDVSAAAATTATATEAPAKAPMGRGRGTTLPAWMTRANGPTKQIDNDDAEDKKSDASSLPSSSSSIRRSKKKRKHRERKGSSRRKDDRRRHKHKRSRKDEHRRRRPRSRSRSRSPSSPHRKRSRSDRGRRDHYYSGSDSDRERSSKTPSNGGGFASLEEARRVVEELEAKKNQTS